MSNLREGTFIFTFKKVKSGDKLQWQRTESRDGAKVTLRPQREPGSPFPRHKHTTFVGTEVKEFREGEEIIVLVQLHSEFLPPKKKKKAKKL